MALILRGNGVVEGLTDLPAGSVTAADLASGAITSSVLPAGSVLQVVSETFSTQTASTANSYVATHITANITPSSTSSKILVIVNSCYGLNTLFSNFRYARIYRNTTGVGNFLRTRAGYFSSNFDITHFTMQHLDSPSTTSSTSYTLYMNNDNGDGFSIGGRYINTNGGGWIMGKNEAIFKLYPNVVTIRGDVAYDADENKVEIDMTAVNAWQDPNTYKYNRQEEYPPLAEQLDYIYHNGVEAWKADMIQPVKDKYPKPE